MSLRRSSQLRAAIDEWVAEGLIGSDQAAALVERYELDAEAPWYKNISFLVGVVAVLLVGMGFVLGISQNWDHLSIPLRVASGALPWLIAAGVTGWAIVAGRDRLAEAWALLACLLYGTNIFLQAQIFHISGYAPDGVMWWLIGSIPVAVLLRSHVLTFLVQALTVVWIGLESEFDHFSPMVLPLGAVALLVTRAALGRFTLVGAIAVVIWMVHHVRHPIYGAGGPDEILTALVASGTLAMALLSVAQPVSPGFREDVSWVALAFVLFNAFIASSTSINEELVLTQNDWYASLVAGVSVLILLRANRSPVAITTAAIAVWFGVGTLLPETTTLNMVFTYGLNLIIFGGAVLMVYRGVREQHKAWFMGGLVLIVIHAVVRYFDLFEDYLVSSVIFILAGIGLVLANRFWKRRFDA